MRIFLLLAATLAAQEENPYAREEVNHDTAQARPDSIPTREVRPSGVQIIYNAPKDIDAMDYQSKMHTLRPSTLSQPNQKTQSDYLQLAGYHWLYSIGMGVGAGVLGFVTDWKQGPPHVVMWGLFAGSICFQIAVPFDLILAGKAPIGPPPPTRK